MAMNERSRYPSEQFVEIRDQQVCRGCTVTVPRRTFGEELRLGDWMRFERVVAGKIETLSGMVVDLDAEIIEIDVPYRQPRMAP
jgi:hypothetical protein